MSHSKTTQILGETSPNVTTHPPWNQEYKQSYPDEVKSGVNNKQKAHLHRNDWHL